jgi:hypothetical protein
VNLEYLDAYSTRWDLDDMNDALELKTVHASWVAASYRNAEHQSEQRRARDAAMAKLTRTVR